MGKVFGVDWLDDKVFYGGFLVWGGFVVCDVYF